MLDPVVYGISYGLVLAIMLGPVFFTLLQTSLHEGFKAGLHLAIGVLISDATVILICYFFASQLNLLENYKVVMGWVGGILMIGFGVFNFFRTIKIREVDDNKKTVHAKFMLNGFLLNIINPAVLLFWIGVVSLISVKEHYNKPHELVFFGSLLGTVFLTDLLKAYVANRIKNLLKPEVMKWINRIIGLILVGFGVSMIVKVIGA